MNVNQGVVLGPAHVETVGRETKYSQALGLLTVRCDSADTALGVEAS